MEARDPAAGPGRGLLERFRRGRSPMLAGAAIGFLVGVASVCSLGLLLRAKGSVAARDRLRSGEAPLVVRVPIVQAPLPHPLTGSPRGLAHERFRRGLQDRGFPAEAPVATGHDLLCLGRVGIGEPAQQFVVVFDFRSAHLWVPSRALQHHHCHHPHHPWALSHGAGGDIAGRRFDGRLSRTYRPSHVAVTIPQGAAAQEAPASASCSGHLARDTMQLGGAKVPGTVLVESFAAPPAHDTHGLDGVLGLGLPAPGAPPELESPLDAVARALGSQGLTRRVLHLILPSQGNKTGELLIGDVPRSSYPRGVNWVPVVGADSRWVVRMDRVFLGQSPAALGRVGVVDPGTSCIVMPAADAREFFRLSREAAARDSRCAAQPTISVSIGGHWYSLRGEDYGSRHLGSCVVCVQADADASAWVLGHVFLKKFPAAFDFGASPPRVGLPRTWRAEGSRILLWLLMPAALLTSLVLWRASRSAARPSSPLAARQWLMHATQLAIGRQPSTQADAHDGAPLFGAATASAAHRTSTTTDVAGSTSRSGTWPPAHTQSSESRRVASETRLAGSAGATSPELPNPSEARRFWEAADAERAPPSAPQPGSE